MNKKIKNTIKSFLIFVVLTSLSFSISARGRFQNADFKTLDELIGAGADITELLNDTKIYSTVASETLSGAFQKGILGLPAWVSGTSYRVDALVYYTDNNIYKCLTANSDITFTPSKWQQLGGGSGGSGALTVYGSFASPIELSGSTLTPNNVQRQIIYIKSDGGANTVSIAADTVIGRELILRGVSDTDYLVINDGAGTSQNGAVNIKSNQQIDYVWNGMAWDEVSRRY